MNKKLLSLTLGAVLAATPLSLQLANAQQVQTPVQQGQNPYQQAAPATTTVTTVTTPVSPQAQPSSVSNPMSGASAPATATMTPDQVAMLQRAYVEQAQQLAYLQAQVAAQQAQSQLPQPSNISTMVASGNGNAQTQTAPSNPPKSLPPLPSDFELGVQQVMPMTPDEIRTLRRMLDSRQKAASDLPNPPRSVTGSVSVSLDPGSTPAVIRPFFGNSTSLVLLDSTGSAWPVENFTVGNRSLFAVERLDGATGSSFVITPTQMYGQSNLILKLVGHPTPVVISLVSGQKVHDARVEARVLGRGPNASVTSVSLMPGVDSRLLSVLDGVAPQGRAIKVAGDGSSKAWMMPNGRLWVRTSLSLVSPAPISFVSASDGTHVYEVAPSPTLLGMLNNQFVTLKLEGCLQECGSGSSTTQSSYDW